MGGRQDTGQKENFFVVLGAIVVFAFLTWVAMRSPYILHRIELPVLQAQAKTYSVAAGVYGREHAALTSLRTVINEEYKRNGYKRINAGKAREFAYRYGEKTILTSKIIALILLVAGIIPFVRSSLRARKYAYDKNQYIPIPPVKGVEGFIMVIGKHLPDDIKERLRAEPTVENLTAAFTIAREKANIPNNIVGRLFPRWSKERFALYEYGKGFVEYDVNRMMKMEGKDDVNAASTS